MSAIVGGFLLIGAAAAHTLDLFVSFAFITLLFAMIYKFMPDVRIAWSDVWIGAGAASVLFSVGKFLIGFYSGLQHGHIHLMVRLLHSLLICWVYYSSVMFFFALS